MVRSLGFLLLILTTTQGYNCMYNNSVNDCYIISDNSVLERDSHFGLALHPESLLEGPGHILCDVSSFSWFPLICNLTSVTGQYNVCDHYRDNTDGNDSDWCYFKYILPFSFLLSWLPLYTQFKSDEQTRCRRRDGFYARVLFKEHGDQLSV